MPVTSVPAAWAGPEGLVLSHALLVTLMVGLTVLGIIQRGATLEAAVAGGVAALILGLPLIGAIRPRLFSAAALPLVLLACTQLTRGRRPLWWLPILFALWANLHGSFTMGLAVLAVVCVSKTREILQERGGWRPALADPQLPRFYLALALSVAGCCMNPQGIGLLMMGPALVGSGPVGTSWQPMVLNSLSGILFFSSLFLTMVLIRRSPRRIGLQEVLLLTVFGTAALLSTRMLLGWALVWPWVVAPHGLAVWRSWRDCWADEGEQNDVQYHATTMHPLIAMAFVSAALLVAPPTHGLITGRCLGEGALAPKDTPLYVADEIERRGIQGRIFVPLAWADYLIWHSKGQVQPLANWHTPSLPSHVSNDQQQLAQGSSQWLKIVDRHRLQYMVLSRERNATLRRTIRRHARTKILYQDQRSVLVQILPPRQPRTS